MSRHKTLTGCAHMVVGTAIGGRMHKGVRRTLVGLATMITLLSFVQGAGTASADRAAARVERVLSDSSSSSEATPLSACAVQAFFYVGYKKCGTLMLVCDFNLNGTPDEAWVVADNRTIWHAWPGSGGWRQMPNNGRADDMYACDVSEQGHRIVKVWVANIGVYYSWRDNSGVWHGWYRD